MHRGYIKKWRRCQDNPLYFSEPFTRWQAWEDLLLIANYREGMIVRRGIQVFIERGMVGWSEEQLGKRWKWSRGKVRRFFEMLMVNDQIERKIAQKTVQKKSSVSYCYFIINYDRYQTNEPENEPEDGTEDGRKTDGRRYRNKKDKKDKKDKNKECALPEWINPVTWTEYKRMRTRIRKPMTPHAGMLIINKLEKFKEQGHDPNEILESSIANSWQGVFEPSPEREKYL